MNENPYKSPQCASGREKRLTKRHNDFGLVAVCGFCGFMGTTAWLPSISWLFGAPSGPPDMPLPMVLSMFLFPVIVGMAMARWAWRHPESKRLRRVALLLMMSAFIPFLIHILVFGARF